MAVAVPLASLVAALQGAESAGDLPMPIHALSHDSRRLGPGSLFIAIPGTEVDGHRYIGEAVARGAVAVLAQAGNPLGAAQKAMLPPEIPWVWVPDSRRAEAEVAAAFYGFPARRLRTVGVTGTDGKTTTTFLVAAILEAAGHRAGLLNTVVLKTGPESRSNRERMSTLDALQLQGALAEMVAQGMTHAVIEATSHGLAQDRVHGCDFDAAVLTNLTGDHLDYHGTFEEYRKAKGRLFQMLSEGTKRGPKVAVVNADDPSADFFLGLAAGAEAWTFGLRSPAAVIATELAPSATVTRFQLRTPHGETLVTLPLPGRFNVANALAAAAVALGEGIALEKIRAGLEVTTRIPGRMEVIDEGQPYRVVVDYAHTPHGLRTVLETLRPSVAGRLIVLFGAVGGRERPRRYGLGQVAGQMADFAVLTSEDPHWEDPMAILRDIASALEQEGRHEGEDFLLIPDRRLAIEQALRMAQPQDLVLLAGKGHEPSIIIGDQQTPWDEAEAARGALRTLLSVPGS